MPLRLLIQQATPMKLLLAVAIVFIVAPLTAAAAGHTKGRAVEPFTSALKPGDYVWRPEVSPAGPVVIIVSLAEQRMYVYRNGVRIGQSTVSTGKKGHATPTGTFTILQKKVRHESNIYKGARMPHMQRLTWTGIAMHAGHLPGYPASHGCVRLPIDFAEKLYAVTRNGTSVIITDDKFSAGETAEPGLLLSGQTEVSATPVLTAGQFEWHPDKAATGPVSIILSTSNEQAYVYRNGVEIGRAAISVSTTRKDLGSHVYSALDKVDPTGRREWMATASLGARHALDIKQLANHISIAPEFLQHARAVISPGTTLIITDVQVGEQTRSGPGFEILTTD
jgi:hypothetical protein